MEVGRKISGEGTFVNVSPRFRRSMTRPFFNRDCFEPFDRHVDQVIAKMKERLNKEGVPVDVQNVLSRFTLNTAMVPLTLG